MKPSYLKSFVFGCLIVGALFPPGGFSDASGPQRKVVVCHRGNVIDVAESAVQAHLNHGDPLGPCQITPGQNR